MINEIEKKLLKNSWRLFVVFWAALAGLVALLHNTGFLAIPASAVDLEHIAQIVKKNEAEAEALSKNVEEIKKNTAVGENEIRNVGKRLESIATIQRETQRDIKQILRILSSHSD